jgi:hypothetical protein
MNFSCVYSIQSKDKEVKDLYIGSCKNYRKRYNRHKESYKNCNFLVYQFIRQNGGWDNWDMIVEVKTDDLSKEDRRILEQCYIDLLEPTLNSKNVKGWDMERKKNYDKNYKKEYRKTDKYINSRKIKINCPHCNKKILKNNISRHIKKQHL